MRPIITIGLFTLLASPVAAQGETVSSDHLPNAQTLACLEAPTRDCALTSALQTVIAEEFGLERAKVLTGVGQALIEIGKPEDARQTLMLALDEARSVNLALVTHERIKDIAPLLALAGDVASALALTEELTITSLKDNVLAKIAEAAASNGNLADTRVALRQMSNQARAFWQELTLLPRMPEGPLSTIKLEDVERDVRALQRPAYKYRGLIQLAILADRKRQPGERAAYLAEAEELFPSVLGIQARADVTAQRASQMFLAGMDPVFVEQAYELALLHGSRLRSNDELSSFAMKVGPVEAGTGRIMAALERLKAFPEFMDQARYLATLKASRDGSLLASEIRGVLEKLPTLDGAYDRDLVRLKLLEGARLNRDLQLGRTIVEAMEDDDNQALGVALLAPLLE